jgi:hypothetical protein
MSWIYTTTACVLGFMYAAGCATLNTNGSITVRRTSGPIVFTVTYPPVVRKDAPAKVELVILLASTPDTVVELTDSRRSIPFEVTFKDGESKNVPLTQDGQRILGRPLSSLGTYVPLGKPVKFEFDLRQVYNISHAGTYALSLEPLFDFRPDNVHPQELRVANLGITWHSPKSDDAQRPEEG